MSTDATSDEIDDLDLPAIDEDAVSTGAAADSSETDERFRYLPRLLRYAMLVSTAADHVDQRLAAEIDQICPDLGLNAGWLISRGTEIGPALGTELGLLLATELDQRAVGEDRPELRSLADCVRLMSLPAPHDTRYFGEHRRVAKSLLMALRGFAQNNDDGRLCSEVEEVCFGWAALPCCSHMLGGIHSAAYAASVIGASMAKHRVNSTKIEIWRQIEEKEEKEEKDKAKERSQDSYKTGDAALTDALTAPPLPEHHLVVARLSDEQMKNAKLKEIIGPLKGIINTALPLVMAPPLHQARTTLMFEFPYATEVIDFALADLVGRTTVHLRPLLLVGDPGGGKSRFARRLGEVLGLNVWRNDASRADGATFGGTDRRWYSPNRAIRSWPSVRARLPIRWCSSTSLEKAGTRADYGRLWDTLLSFLEPETNCRYPDSRFASHA